MKQRPQEGFTQKKTELLFYELRNGFVIFGKK